MECRRITAEGDDRRHDQADDGEVVGSTACVDCSASLRPDLPAGYSAHEPRNATALDDDAEAAVRRISIVKLTATILIVYAVTLAAMLMIGLLTG